jgi:hypothetical protein
MWTTESIDVAWIWSVPNAELHIPNKDPTKAPTKVTADVTITMNSHDGHHGSGPDWPHYGATIELGNLSRKDVTWAVDGKQTYEQMKAGDIQRSPPITQDLTLHVLCDVVPASQAADELMTEEEIKVARKMAGRSPSGSSEGEDEEQDQEDKKKGKKDKKEE